MSRIIDFWLPVVGFNLRHKDHALLLNTGIMHESPVTRTRRLTLGCPAISSFKNRASPASYGRCSVNKRYRRWVVEDVLKRLAAVHGAVHSDLTLSPTSGMQRDTPGAHAGVRVCIRNYGAYELFCWQLRRALAVTHFRAH